MNILIIEDDSLKYKNISDYLRSFSPFSKLVWQKSYHSGLKELLTNKYDLILLDMSMHIYDKSAGETGGSFENYAGQLILREMDMLEMDTKVIIVTMFDTFPDGKTLLEIKDELKSEFSNFYLDTVYYSSSETKWKLEISNLIKENFHIQEDTNHNEIIINILLVDDSKFKIDNVSQLIYTLSPKAVITTAQSAIDAINLLQKHKYDLLIVDMLLPLRLGEEPQKDGGGSLLEELNHDDLIKIPNSIIALTAYDELQENIRILFEDIAVVKFDQTSEKWKDSISRRVKHVIKSKSEQKLIIYCEDQNDTLYNAIEFPNVEFRGLRGGSRYVYLAAKNEKDNYAVRDRDYLMSLEIAKTQQKLNNYFILNYYCFENYLYHPDNIEELQIKNFNKSDYMNDIINQKNIKLIKIVQDLKTTRATYTDFTDNHKSNMLNNLDEILTSLQSNEFEEFYKFFDMKGSDKTKGYEATYLEKFNLKQELLVKTNWINNNIKKVFKSLF